MRVLAWDVGVINLAYCLMEKDANNYKIIEWNTINLLEHTNEVKGKKPKPGIGQLKLLLVKKLDQIKERVMNQCDVVIVENQPVLKNPTMKALGGCIYDYFLIRGRVDTQLLKEVSLASPVNKLKLGVLDPAEIECIKGKCKTNYLFNKKMSVQSCEKLLHEKGIQLNTDTNFHSIKKKDDLADACLMAYHFLQKNQTTCC